MKKAVKKTNPLLLKFGLSILTIIIVAGIVFSTYYFTLNKEDSKYINVLYKYKIEVDKSNASTTDAIKNIDNLASKDDSEIKNIEETFSTAESNLKNILQDIQQVRAPAKYKLQYDNYTNGILSNKEIFHQANLILKNTKSSTLKNALNSLSGYVSDTTKFYEESKLKKATIKLPSEILAMSDTIGTYAFNAYKDFENKTQNLEAYTAYFKAMDDVLKNFDTAKIDLYTNMSLIKSNTLSLDDVYAIIESKISENEDIQTAYSNLTVPPKMGARHKQMDDIIKSYYYYCQDFKIALNKYEESLNDSTLTSGVTASFNDLNTTYKNLSKRFTSYWSSYTDDKLKYSDINNL